MLLSYIVCVDDVFSVTVSPPSFFLHHRASASTSAAIITIEN